MAEIDDIIAGYTGKREPARHTLADRGTHSVVTDPNTDLLRQLVQEVRLMRYELAAMRDDYRRSQGDSTITRNTWEQMRRLMRDEEYRQLIGPQPVFPKSLLDQIKANPHGG